MKPMTDLMFEVEEILKTHARRYPLMQPTDAVKLIFQNEFGGGHLIRDEQACLQYLRREYASVTHDASAARYEQIGNGIVRVRLSALEETELEQLGRDFIRSAAIHQGTPEGFLEKLEVLRAVTKQGIFSFPSEALEAYLEDYAKAGYPAVSHSQVYRDAYQPAYRVICREFCL